MPRKLDSQSNPAEYYVDVRIWGSSNPDNTVTSSVESKIGKENVALLESGKISNSAMTQGAKQIEISADKKRGNDEAKCELYILAMNQLMNAKSDEKKRGAVGSYDDWKTYKHMERLCNKTWKCRRVMEKGKLMYLYKQVGILPHHDRHMIMAMMVFPLPFALFMCISFLFNYNNFILGSVAAVFAFIICLRSADRLHEIKPWTAVGCHIISAILAVITVVVILGVLTS